LPWPTSQDYNEAVQNPAASFADPELRQGRAVVNALGLPMPCSGNFADVYHVTGPGRAAWAVKCFTRQVPGLRERYTSVSSHLQRRRLGFMVEFGYVTEGVRVRGQWYPVVKMRWVEGHLLNEFVRDSLDRPTLLDRLLHLWVRMSRRLRGADMAHGDIQHGNVILVPDEGGASVAVRLIDYDGMWVPALQGKPSGEVGHSNYQHPQRLREGSYGPEVDRFPLLVVAAALCCLRVGGRGLWDRYDDGDNLLFKEADFADPHHSQLFAELLQLPDAEARSVVAQLMAACQKPLEQTPLLEEVFAKRPSAVAVPLSVGDDFAPPTVRMSPQSKSDGPPVVAARPSGPSYFETPPVRGRPQPAGPPAHAEPPAAVPPVQEEQPELETPGEAEPDIPVYPAEWHPQGRKKAAVILVLGLPMALAILVLIGVLSNLPHDTDPTKPVPPSEPSQHLGKKGKLPAAPIPPAAPVQPNAPGPNPGGVMKGKVLKIPGAPGGPPMPPAGDPNQPPAGARPPDNKGKPAVPDKKALDKAIGDIQEEFKGDFGKLQLPVARKELAERLFAEGQKCKDNSDRRYALYDEASRLAAEADEFELCLKVVDAMARVFQTSLRREQVRALYRVKRSLFDAPQTAPALVKAVLPVLDEAIKENDFATVGPLVELTRLALVKVRDQTLIKLAGPLLKQFPE
jgi:hypothetical protein